jgi:uncharacterized membrane protein
MKTAIPLLALLLCYAFFFGFVFGTYSYLPERVSSHFDAAGRPNGWMSRDATVEFSVFLGIFLPIIMIGLTLLGGFMPASMMNLPNRDYWLAPPQRRAMRWTLLRFGLWFACLNVLFVTGIHGLVVLANLPGSIPQLSTFGIALVAGGFIVSTVIWAVLLILYFKRLPSPETT